MKWAALILAGLFLAIPLGLMSCGGVDGGAIQVAGQACQAGNQAGGGGGASAAPVDAKGEAAALSPEGRSIVATVIAVGKRRKEPPKAWQVEIMAAKTESNLKNLQGGDRDSIGPWQMRPSQGWGSEAQLHDVSYQADTFYSHLDKISGWQSKRPGDAAQAVERSQYPERYHKNEAFAAAVIAQNGNVPPAAGAPPADSVSSGQGQAAAGGDGTGCGPSAPSGGGGNAGNVEKAVQFALAQQGKPYVWGASGPNSFDCSGLMQAAFKTIGVTLPRQSTQQYKVGRHIPVQQAKRGDMLFWGASSSNPASIHHVAMSLGNGQMMEAQQDGVPLKISPIRTKGLMPTAETYAAPTPAPAPAPQAAPVGGK